MLKLNAESSVSKAEVLLNLAFMKSYFTYFKGIQNNIMFFYTHKTKWTSYIWEIRIENKKNDKINK